MKGSTKIVSAKQFEAMRAELKAAGMIKKPVEMKIAKARLLVNRKPRVKAGPVKALQKGSSWKVVACLDLSMAKTGIAWGRPGCVPAGTALAKATNGKECEGARFLAMAQIIAVMIEKSGAERVFFAEFYSAKHMLSFRVSAGLRGAVMAKLAEMGIEASGVPEISARKAAGVDVSGKKPGDEKGYMKLRAKDRLIQLGLGHLGEDEGDAAILLIGSSAYLDADEDAGLLGHQAAHPSKYDLSLLA